MSIKLYSSLFYSSLVFKFIAVFSFRVHRRQTTVPSGVLHQTVHTHTLLLVYYVILILVYVCASDSFVWIVSSI